MNIHFDDKYQFDSLRANTLIQKEFGSILYGLEDSESDVDIMNVYLHDDMELFTNHHQFQYKNEGTDYIFTSYKQFLRNLMSGDSSINFEILMSNAFEGNILHSFKDEFITYQIIRGYLGFARRDLEQFNKNKLKGVKYTDRSINKKIIHGIRSYMFADRLMKKVLDGEEFSMKSSHLNHFKNLETYVDRIIVTEDMLAKVAAKREELNKNADCFKKYISIEAQVAINDWYIKEKSCTEPVSISEQLSRAVYDSNVNEISY